MAWSMFLGQLCGCETYSFCVLDSFVFGGLHLLYIIMLPFASLSRLSDNAGGEIAQKEMLFARALRVLLPAGVIPLGGFRVLIANLRGVDNCPFRPITPASIISLIAVTTGWTALTVLSFIDFKRRRRPSTLSCLWLLGVSMLCFVQFFRTGFSFGGPDDDLLIVQQILMAATTCVFFYLRFHRNTPADSYQAFVADDLFPEGLDGSFDTPHSNHVYRTASWLSRLTFWWMSDLMRLGHKRPMQARDIPNVPRWWDESESASALFESRWKSELRSKNPSLAAAFIKSYPRPFIMSGIFKLISDILQFPPPILLGFLLSELEEPKSNSDLNSNLNSNLNSSNNNSMGLNGYIIAVLMVGCSLLQSLCFQNYAFRASRVGMRLRSAIICAVYAKSLRLPVATHRSTNINTNINNNNPNVNNINDERNPEENERVGLVENRDGNNNDGIGDINTVKQPINNDNINMENEEGEEKEEELINDSVNLLTTDATRVQDVMSSIHMIWSVPLTILGCIVMLWLNLGLAALAGVGSMLLILPFNIWLANRLDRFNNRLMELRDQRIRLTAELLRSIQFIKYSNLEKSFQTKIISIRAKESLTLRWCSLTNAFSRVCWLSTPLIVSLSSFVVYASVEGNHITPGVTFTALALFNLLRNPLSLLPSILQSLIQTITSLRRIQNYLLEPEMNRLEVNQVAFSALQMKRRASELVSRDSFSIGRSSSLNLNADRNSNPSSHSGSFAMAVSIVKGTFSWHGNSGFILKNINLGLRQGSFTSVVGPVGAGKTALLYSILGEMTRLKGEVKINGQLAYVSQSPFVFNGTIRDNILFGLYYDEEHYNEVLEATQLIKDINTNMFPLKDQTLLGESGIQLSGGQRARISLARSLYSRADIYLFDSPFANLDPFLGQFIMQKCIRGPLLRGKTVLLVLHCLSYLPQCDDVIMLKDGVIVERGKYETLVNNSEEFQRILTLTSAKTKFIPTATTTTTIQTAPTTIPTTPRKLNNNNTRLDLFSTAGVNITSSFASFEIDDSPVMCLVNQRRRSSLSILGSSIQEDSTLTRSNNDPWMNAANNESDAQISLDGGGELGLESSPLLVRRSRGSIANNNPNNNINVTTNNVNVVNANRLMKDEEERVVGSVHYSVYKEYLNAAGGVPAVVIVVTLFVLFQSSTVGANLWLSYWTQDNNKFPNEVNSVIYSLLILASIFFSLLLAVYMVLSAGKAAKRLHDKLISSIINAPMKFFDSVPVGWIINRFSQDQTTIDDNLGGTLYTFLTNVFAVGGAVCIICTATPFFLLFFIPLSLFYWWEQKYFIRTSRELKRLDGISRSPIYHHHCDSRNGTVTIRAYHREEHFMRLNENILNENQKIFFITNCAHRWIGIRLETVAAVVIAVASLLAVWSKGMVSAGLAGLSISYSLTVTQLLSALVRSSSDRESQIVHVERQKQYAEIESEFNQTHSHQDVINHINVNINDKNKNKKKINKKMINENINENINEKNKNNNSIDINNNNGVVEVPAGWPNKGSISIRQLTLQYADSIKPVLNRISVEIAPKQKIGICGRTGAGKSSLIATLFRIYEPTDGSIFIDDIDISQVRLELLRSRLTIITQNPVLFSGTLRYNLDPENKHSDSEIWEALDHVGLKDAILSSNQQLHAPVIERGMNWSQGERQLLCIARASLRSSSIVIFDEATAYMDVETDNKIQLLLMSLFADCTVLTVAHRLNSIMNYDLILVLENGNVVEFNSPNNLMANPDSTFRNMVNEIRKVKTVNTKRRSFAASFVRNINESELE